MAAYLQRLVTQPLLLTLLGTATLLALTAIPAYLVSRRPRPGSLAWIRRIDRCYFTPLKVGCLCPADSFWALLAALCAAALRLFFLLSLLARAHTANAPAVLLAKAGFYCLHHLLPAGLLGLGLFLLLRILSCNALSAVCAGILGGLLQGGQLWPAVFICFSLLFLCLWMCTDAKAPLFFHALWLPLSGCCYALCLLLCHRAVWLIPLYFGAYIFTQCYRWRNGEAGARVKKLVLSLVLCALTATFLLLVLWAIYVLHSGKMSGGIRILRTFRFYQSLFPELLRRLRNLSVLSPPQKAIGFFDSFTFLSGCSACGCLVHLLFKEHDNAAAMILCLLLPFTLLWLLGGAYLLPLPLLLALGRLWSYESGQGHSGFAVASAGALGVLFYGALFLI